ncbi:unnamed protein product [Thelazia callipaeda]|uniref:TLC domain-containing protein n=1 Tax=Thelazia callipaeda TaxID=103827 RepID=A0A0N5CNR9_THECL|nr:unnamed protein product [Thelazia callipaeda]
MLWSERYWLPKGVSWNDLESNETVRYPDIWELVYAMKYALKRKYNDVLSSIIFRYSVALLLLRIACECFIFLPICCSFGLVKEPLWIRMREHLNIWQANKGKFKKMSETIWRFLFYFSIWIYGLFVLHDQPQFYDVTECWRNWPRHELNSKVWWYYVIETSFYCSLIISSFTFDIRRADFLQMTFHHLITIILLFLSFAMNMVRVGTLVLFSHDLADIFLEFGKICRYAGCQSALTCIFLMFTVAWIATRLIYFPFFIIRSVLFDAPLLIQADYRWENIRQVPIVPRLFVVMLLFLLILHIYWTFLIIKIAIKSTQGKIDDIREDSDDEISSTPSLENVNGDVKNDEKWNKKRD